MSPVARPAQGAERRPRHAFRLVTIDLDDTVWPCAPVIRAAEEALYAWLAAQTPRLAAAHDPLSLREHRRALMAARPDIAHDVTELRRAALAALLAEHGYPEALADHAMAVFRRTRNQVEPYADVAPALTRLRRDLCIVAVTNGNAEVRHTPLRDAFDHVLTAADAGAMRPDPALFRMAMDWAGAAPHETLHVGDDPVRDVDAARRIGLAAVWINRDRAAWPDGLAPPLHEVQDLHGLLHWLETGAGNAL
jgi:putative hydrolase of the HAD superfamily